jgi:sugar phosphate isomerase/epimerase
VLQLDGFYRTLADTGYDGVLSVELFSAVPAPQAYAAMKRLATAVLPAGDAYA